MAFRRNERIRLRLPTTVWGMEPNGTVFVEPARTLDISPSGARLAGITRALAPGTIIGLQHGNASGRFRVIWVGEAGTDREGQIGVACVDVGQAVRKTLLHLGNGDLGSERHRRALEAAGYNVVCAPFKQGLELAQTQSYDAILVEHSATTADSEEVLSSLRQCPPDAPVLILSTQPGRFAETSAHRSYRVVHKGMRERELLAQVEALIGGGNQLKWPITRSSHRYPFITDLKVRLVRSGVVSVFEGKSSDLSESGVGAVLPSAELLPGEIVSVHFTSPATGDISAYGTVRQRDGERYGIEFSDLPEDHRESIRILGEVLPPLTALRS